MTFLWSDVLWLLLGVPVLVGLYFLLLRRRKLVAVRYTSVGLVRDALGPWQRFRRHIPPLLFLLSIVAGIIACARPTAIVTLPSEQRTIIMAMDVSLSMRARDVEPSRLEAAQAAAKAFVMEQPSDVRIGIVAFAGTASLVQAPTRNRDELLAAIDRFELQRHTAIGSGIIVSLAALFPEEGIDLEPFLFRGASRDGGRGVAIDRPDRPQRKPFKPVPPGSHPSAAIILLTDGRATTGPNPIETAKLAAERGVRIYTVGFGTAQGGEVGFEGWSIYVRFDEETLKAIADVTRGEYYYAGSAEDLRKVYKNLNTSLVLERKDTEISALFVAGAAVLATVAALLSLAWFNRSV
jgi:Ca-activated chloride channel family protein